MTNHPIYIKYSVFDGAQKYIYIYALSSRF